MTRSYSSGGSPVAAPLFIALVAAGLDVSAQANPVAPPSAGALGNQLNQELPQRLPSRPIDIPLQDNATQPPVDTQDANLTVRLERVRFDGAQVLSDAQLQRAVLPWLGRDLTLAELRTMMAAVEQLYQLHGYLAVSVVLPVQTMLDGELRLLVTVGRYQQPVVNTAGEREQAFLNALVVRATCKQACDGQTLIETAQVDRALYLVNDLPGVSARGTLKAGHLPATSAFGVNVAPIKRVGGYLDLNNFGNAYTGREVLNAGVQLTSALLVGDQLTLDGVSSLEALQHATGLQQVSANYSLPIGTLGTRFGGGFSHFEYRLNQQFEPLDAHGQADTANAWVSHPLWLSHKGRVDVRLTHEQSRYVDEQLRYARARDVDTTTLDVSGTLYGNRKIAGWRLSTTMGALTYHDPLDQMFDSATRKSAGHFTRQRLDAFGLMGLDYNWAVYGALRTQVSNRNLDSAQGFVMGGANGVRAFNSNAASVDEGWQASLEMRYQRPALGLQWTAAGFYDAAQGRVNRNAWGAGSDAQLRLSGAGVYLAGAQDQQYSVRLTYAQRLRDNLDADVGSDQLWLSLTRFF
ncbi:MULTISPECIES: ShlB/FhaC/HecB family hemolysin secretion/activation protein [unclassified Pseudomonas]|uniref:ShlB/FhaC/HecB family hemolysin secretion/activation protein n=1 Tax=unclassified Pseudomonas TaxID=196821 RepID=UPI001304A299|nr:MULTISPECIES: ShlB/FhaC/HecB family hemolysin secretion/activation protein [unclassified Pseudomonas]